MRTALQAIIHLIKLKKEGYLFIGVANWSVKYEIACFSQEQRLCAIKNQCNFYHIIRPNGNQIGGCSSDQFFSLPEKERGII